MESPNLGVSFYEKLNQPDWPIIQNKGKMTQINILWDKQGIVTIATKEIKNIVNEFFKNLYFMMLDNLKEMN